MRKKYIILVFFVISILIVVFTKVNENKNKVIPDNVSYLVANSYMDAFNLPEKNRMQMFLIGLDESGNEVWSEKYKTTTPDANQFYQDVDGLIQLMTRSGKFEITQDSRDVKWLADLGTDGKGNYVDPTTGANTWTNRAGGYFEESGYIPSKDLYYQLINSALNSDEVTKQLEQTGDLSATDGYSIRLYGDDSTGNDYPVCYGAQSLTYDKDTNNIYFICPFDSSKKMGLSYLNLDNPKVEDYTIIDEGYDLDKLVDTHESIAGYITENKSFYIEEDGYVKVFEDSLFKVPDLKKNKVTKYQISKQGFKKIMSLNSNYSDDKFSFATINMDKSVSVHYLDKNTYKDTVVDLDYVVSDENQNSLRPNPPYVYIGENYYIVTEPLESGGNINEYKFTEFDSKGNITNSFTHDFEYTEASSIIKV